MPTALREALPQRAGRGFDAGRRAELGMPRRLRVQLPEALQLVHRQVVAGEMQQRVEQHRAVAVRDDEAIAVRPLSGSPGCARDGGSTARPRFRPCPSACRDGRISPPLRRPSQARGSRWRAGSRQRARRRSWVSGRPCRWTRSGGRSRPACWRRDLEAYRQRLTDYRCWGCLANNCARSDLCNNPKRLHRATAMIRAVAGALLPARAGRGAFSSVRQFIARSAETRWRMSSARCVAVEGCRGRLMDGIHLLGEWYECPARDAGVHARRRAARAVPRRPCARPG